MFEVHVYRTCTPDRLVDTVSTFKKARKLMEETFMTELLKIPMEQVNGLHRDPHYCSVHAWVSQPFSVSVYIAEQLPPPAEQEQTYRNLVARYAHVKNELENLKWAEQTDETKRLSRNLSRKLWRLTEKLVERRPGHLSAEDVDLIWSDAEDVVFND